jgi:hypothetical protein
LAEKIYHVSNINASIVEYSLGYWSSILSGSIVTSTNSLKYSLYFYF